MDSALRFLQLACLLMGITPSFPESLLLSNSQRHVSLRATENKNHSASQFIPADAEEHYPAGQLFGRNTAASFPIGSRRKPDAETWDENPILSLLLTTIVKQDLKDCDLVLACNAAFWGSNVMQVLLMLPNVRQVSAKTDDYNDRTVLFFFSGTQFIPPLMENIVHFHSPQYTCKSPFPATPASIPFSDCTGKRHRGPACSKLGSLQVWRLPDVTPASRPLTPLRIDSPPLLGLFRKVCMCYSVRKY